MVDVWLIITFLYYIDEGLTGKYTTCENHLKLHLGLMWGIFHVLASEDIDNVISLFFMVVWVNSQFVCIIRRKLHGGLRIWIFFSLQCR